MRERWSAAWRNIAHAHPAEREAVDPNSLPLLAAYDSVLSGRCCWPVWLPCAGGVMHAAAGTEGHAQNHAGTSMRNGRQR